jgi:sigma-B regulation protein RsbU (phosphoserine phosphatase)
MRSAPLSKSVQTEPEIDTEDYKDLYDAAPCGYISVSADGRIALANERIASWTGHAKAALIGKRIQDLLSVPARIFYETNVSPLLRMQGFVDEVAMNFIASDGTKLQCLVNAAERRGDAGKLLFTRLTIFNATERRRYERALVEKEEVSGQEAAAEREASQLREQFIAVLGHDLRNPLASITSGVGLLAGRETISEQGQMILSLMKGSVIRASDLIDNVLDFARGRLGGGITLTRNAEAPLTPVLEQVVAELALVSPDHKITADIEISDPVDCDRTRIAQLLSNLLGNAVTHGAKEQPIVVRAVTQGEELVITIANGGDPISESAMEKLFEPFFRGDHRPDQMGLGLGLHIASEIAKAHGGTLAVTSTPAQTRFTFSMPLISACS